MIHQMKLIFSLAVMEIQMCKFYAYSHFTGLFAPIIKADHVQFNVWGRGYSNHWHKWNGKMCNYFKLLYLK